jgi:hypothetical protein
MTLSQVNRVYLSASPHAHLSVFGDQQAEAKALLLQSRLDYVQAAAEMAEAIGRTPQLRNDVRR